MRLSYDGAAKGNSSNADGWKNRGCNFRVAGWVRAALLLCLAFGLPGELLAQQFEHLDPLYFTRPFGQPDPLPQVLAVASTAANFNFSVTAAANNSGTWLSVSPVGLCCTTPRGVSVIVNTGSQGAAMPAGTYTGAVTFSAGGVTTQVVPVTLVIAPVTATFFDNTPGQVSFSMNPNGQPPPQALQIRNAGAGTLNWSLSTTTFNGGNWLNVSATSGTAPSVITVSIVPANLPNAGALTGTYSGQLLFQTAGGASIVSVPVGITVSPNAMPQVNSLSFSKPFAGLNPLPQIVTIASLGTASNFSVASADAAGSTSTTSWLSTSPVGLCCTTPKAVTITVAPAVPLAAGTYTGQVTVDNSTQLMVIPVYLTIGAPSATFFDNVAGQLSFSLQTAQTNAPPPQLVQIRNAGAGTLAWTLTATTFDSNNWLTVSATSGTAPSQISIGIVPGSLPNAALTAGVYTANLLFQSGNTSVTVPITVQVGPGFEQVNGLFFTMPQNGANPLTQNVNIASTGAAFNFSVTSSTATGGNWLSVAPVGLCCTTPRNVQVSITAPTGMAAGTYTGEVVIYGPTTAQTIPVTLTVGAPATPYLDNLPGELTFTMTTHPAQPPSPQVFQIRNAGTGTLNWTLTPLTFDSASWLTVSAQNGVAPALVTVGVVPGNLPNGGLVAGTFLGQLLVQTAGSSYTIPVSVEVGGSVFGQTSGLSFTMPQNGANPLPQILTVTGIGSAINFTVAGDSANGGNWLTVSPVGLCCTTPRTVTVGVSAPTGMAAGTYTGEVSLYSGTVSETIPVTLTVAAPNTAFFDNVPGQLNYSMVTNTGTPINPAPQLMQIRNAGTGTLAWTAQTSTVDGGSWLTISATSGTAPSPVTVSIVTANLPNAGLVAGLFTGQVLFLSGGSNVTVPVSVLVGGTGFSQINGIDFTMPQAGANPLPQTLTTTSIGNALNYSVTGATGNGGNWMTVSPVGLCCTTPRVFTVSINAPAGMAAGTYTSEVIVDGTNSAEVVPVTLTVAPPTVPFFDNLQGQMSFSAATATTPASQNILVEGLGPSALAWTLTPMTADNGNWLTVSNTSGTVPSTVTVGIIVANLPNAGLLAGQFTGQLLFQSGTSSVTVPVSLQLGPNSFTQMAPLTFTMPYGGGNPVAQSATVAGNGTGMNFNSIAQAGNGGNWLSVSPVGLCCTTPRAITFTVNGSPGGTPVPAGVHTGQAVFNATNVAMTVPVILTVQGTPVLSVAKSHTGNFTVGQSNVTYTIIVSNKATAGVGITSGTVTVTDTLPTGMTLVSMAGNNWTCQTNTCTRSDALNPSQSYDSITVTANVAANAQESLVNQVSVSGGGSIAASASDPTTVITKCDINADGNLNVSDVQIIINQALGVTTANNDLNHDGVVNVADVQIAINAALGSGCSAS